MTNVIQYLIELSNEQKEMFSQMSEKVQDVEDKMEVILFRIEELSNKVNRD